MDTLIITGSGLTVNDVVNVARHGQKIELHPDARKRILECRAMLEKKIDAHEIMYGVNTGIGEFSEMVLNDDQIKDFQKYLVYNHALLHISTDFVFDGKLRRPYRPEDLPNPLSSYGRSKLAGEQAVLSVLGNEALIIRTSWLYGAVGKNFLNTILRLLREKDFLNVVNDQFGSPTSVMSLTSAIYAAIRADVQGLHHWCDEGVISWHGFAKAIQHEALDLGMLIKFKEINPVPGSEYKTKAVRPAWSALDCSTLCEAIKFKTTPWLECLKLTLQHLKEKKIS